MQRDFFQDIKEVIVKEQPYSFKVEFYGYAIGEDPSKKNFDWNSNWVFWNQKNSTGYLNQDKSGNWEFELNGKIINKGRVQGASLDREKIESYLARTPVIKAALGGKRLWTAWSIV